MFARELKQRKEGRYFPGERRGLDSSWTFRMSDEGSRCHVQLGKRPLKMLHCGTKIDILTEREKREGKVGEE